MKDILCYLDAQLKSDRLPREAVPALRECIALLQACDPINSEKQLAELLEALLATIIKPLFARTAVRLPYGSSFLDSPKRPWKDTAPWSVKVLEWTLDQYVKLETPHQKHAIEAQIPLLVPPILTLLDDEDLSQKKAGCRCLEVLSNNVVSCQSNILERTGIAKVFEDTLAPSMLLLPSLTPEKQSLEILGSLYPAYRALVQASSSAGSSQVPADAGKLVSLGPGRQSDTQRILDQHKLRQAMLDRLLRNGILAGYIHASDYVHIAALLVSEMSCVIAMMGASSAKYLSQLLPQLRSILTNPLGASCQSLLRAAAAALRQLILQCWPRIEKVWWEECFRATIGLWLLLSEEDDITTNELKHDARALVQLLEQLKGPLEAWKNLNLLQAECGQLEGLVSAK
jgi:tRNA nucleotidyltransferase (CCA-adding enzyme)